MSLTYIMCQYDKTLEYGKLLPWYAAFPNRDLLEIEDLKRKIFSTTTKTGTATTSIIQLATNKKKEYVPNEKNFRRQHGDRPVPMQTGH